MPANPTSVVVTTQAAVPRTFEAGIPVIVAVDSSYATVNEPKRYFSPDSLTTDHGTATKVGKAARLMFRNRARSVVVIKPKTTAILAEAHGTNATGTITNKPISVAAQTPVCKVDTVSKTVKYTTASPPVAGASGECVINPYTGEYNYNGVVTTSITFDYTYIDFTGLVDALNSKKADIGPYTFVMLSGQDAKADNYGDIKGLADKCKDNDWFLVAQTPNAETVANGKTFRTALENQHAMLVAHKDSANEPAAAVIGMASRVNPWQTKAYKKLTDLDTDLYLPSEIGEVATADTFEGEGLNPVHLLGNVNVLTNERTAVAFNNAGVNAEYYASRTLMRINLKQRLEVELTALLLETDVTYDEKGIGAAVGRITKVLEDLVSAGAIFGQSAANPDKRYAIVEPDLATTPTAQTKARELGPFQVSCYQRESAHKITVDVALGVA